MIPEGFITNLLDRADIVDVVGRYAPLKKAGRNYMCCCPFHKEKTPSFSVNPAKQFFKCFGCGKGGNAIGFVMEIEHLSFPEAVEKLAGFYGMEVPKDTSPRALARREKSRTLADYMREAADFYTAELRRAPRVIDYLRGRAISGETAARYGLGYSPDGWHALQGIFKDKYGAPELLEVGLVNEKNGRRYDAFRDRLMFPIRNPKGQVIGFGARTLKGDEQPKYLNSPETPIYHKGSELYGLFEGRDALHEKGRAIVCEGYMDVIQLAQAGFRESVAALGTSITPEHVKKLLKLTDRVYFSFDGDGAGRKAARRALEAALPVIADTQQAFFILLPPEHDPDSLIKAEGPEGFEREIKEALTLSGFMKRLLLEGKEMMYAEERAKLVAEAKPWILSMQHAPVLRLTLVKEIAAMARLQVEDVERQYGLAQAAPIPSGRGVPTTGGFGGRFRTNRDGFGRNRTFGTNGARRFERGWGERFVPERRLPVKDVRERMLQCFLAYPQFLSEFSASIEDEFVSSAHPTAERILEVWRASGEAEAEAGRVRPATLLQLLSESPNRTAYEGLLDEELVLETPEEGARIELRRSFLDLELERTRARLLAMSQEERPDFERMRPLMARRDELQGLLRSVREEEEGYRRRTEACGRMAAEGADGKGLALSANPKVRRLQEHLFGKPADRPAEAEGLAPAPAQREGSAGRSAVAEAVALVRERRRAEERALGFDGSEGGGAADPLPLAEETDFTMPAPHLEEVPPPEDEVPWTFDEDSEASDPEDFGLDGIELEARK